MNKPVIYTVGHSTHPIEYFIGLLKSHSVNCIVDVRSLAVSRFNPQYNKKALNDSLAQHGIKYFHFAESFGARQTDPELLNEKGQVDFKKIRASDKFGKGVIGLRELVQQDYIICLMCSESEPLNCHRFAMISPALKEDFELKHILKDRRILTQPQLEERLLASYSKKIAKPDMFNTNRTPQEKLNDAYELCSKKIAYSPMARKK
jgi:uncharacterized protein (DUF488 family)